MEMTITVHLPRRRPRPVDVIVRWSGEHTAADLASALADHLGEPVPLLSAGARTIDPSMLVGMPPLVHGASVTVGGPCPSEVAAPAGSVVHLAVVGGPDCGRSRPLTPPGLAVGRAVGGGLAVDDEALSRVHARVRVGPSGVRVEDLGSTNGVVVDGRRVHGATAVDGSSTLVMGSSTLRLRRGGGVGLAVQTPGDGTVLVRPPGAADGPASELEVECPVPPPARHGARIPWLGALVPVPIAVALAVVVGPQLLLFALVGPLVLLANAVADRWGAGRAHRRATAEHAKEMLGARQRLARALLDEVARLDAAHPDPHAVLRAAEGRLPTLWRGGDLAVRLGLGEVPTRVAWLEGASRTHPLAQHAPVIADLTDLGCLGVVGPPGVTDRVVGNAVGQLCVRHPPDRLIVTVAGGGPSWAWTSRMPHVASTWPAAVSARAGPAPVEVLVVPSTAASGMPDVMERARAAGVPVLAAATSTAGLPPCCTAVVEATGDGRHTLTSAGATTSLTLDLVGSWWTDRVARALAPLRPAGEGRRAERQGTITLCEVLGETQLTPDAVQGRWERATGGGRVASAPVAAVGVGPGGVHQIDLRRDGPHVLVGGTTGSGKSEFLRTLVTSLALGSPPADLCFVLVDFKGGAAFGPCADLPHVVGLVTDLDDQLVARVLTSLGAELRRRERIFAAAGASDLGGYLRCRGPDDEQVPRLVIVVDELRALVDEVPEFVNGMVRLAALGRSLGVHLVLATQRPSGVVTAEIQANVNLRIAFRVRDRADSLGILDDAAAAGLSPETPGRALASRGTGALAPFQAAVVAPARRPVGRHLSVAPAAHALRAAALDPPHAPHTPHEEGKDAEQRLAEVAEVVSAVVEAHHRTCGIVPAPPWVPALPARVDPLAHPTSPPGAVVAGIIDEPDLQRCSPLTWVASSATWLLAGRPRSGRTTAARAVALAAASTHDPDRLHLHVLDTGGSLADLAVLPHVGTHRHVDDARAVRDLVTHLRDEVDKRREVSDVAPRAAPTTMSAPHILLVVDGWERLIEAGSAADATGQGDDLLRLLRDGEGVGITGVVTGGRSLLQPSWGAVGASVFLLGTVDPLDAALAGLRTADLPTSPPPGRAVRVADRRGVHFATAEPATSDVVARRVAGLPRAGRGSRPFVLRPLPRVVRRGDTTVLHGRGAADPGSRGGHLPLPEATGDPTPLPLGVAGSSATTWEWVPDRMGRRLLVAGPPRSGRTNALQVVRQGALMAGLLVAVVGCKVVERRTFVGAHVVGPDDVDALVALRRARPDLVLLVDDADLLDDAPVAPAIREISALVDRDGGLVVVTTSPSSVLGRFRGIDVEMARHRTGLLLTPRPGDTEVFGLRRQSDGIPCIAGRALACTPAGVTELQVFLADGEAGRPEPPSGCAVPAGNDVVPVAHGDGSQSADDGHRHHAPTDESSVPLDQPHPHGDEQQVPDDRGRAGPGGASHPSPADDRQGHRADEDEHGRHEHPGRVAPLSDRQLVDVERGEPHERQGLQPREQPGHAAGAA